MSPDRSQDRTVVLHRSSDLFEVEAIAQELRAAGITCNIEGRETSAAFMGLAALDGVTIMNVVVLESDAPTAREIAEQWIKAGSSDDQDDGT